MIAAPVLFLLATQVQTTPRDTTATLPASPIARLEVSRSRVDAAIVELDV